MGLPMNNIFCRRWQIINASAGLCRTKDSAVRERQMPLQFHFYVEPKEQTKQKKIEINSQTQRKLVVAGWGTGALGGVGGRTVRCRSVVTKQSLESG